MQDCGNSSIFAILQAYVKEVNSLTCHCSEKTGVLISKEHLPDCVSSCWRYPRWRCTCFQQSSLALVHSPHFSPPVTKHGRPCTHKLLVRRGHGSDPIWRLCYDGLLCTIKTAMIKKSHNYALEYGITWTNNTIMYFCLIFPMMTAKPVYPWNRQLPVTILSTPLWLLGWT